MVPHKHENHQNQHIHDTALSIACLSLLSFREGGSRVYDPILTYFLQDFPITECHDHRRNQILDDEETDTVPNLNPGIGPRVFAAKLKYVYSLHV